MDSSNEFNHEAVETMKDMISDTTEILYKLWTEIFGARVCERNMLLVKGNIIQFCQNLLIEATEQKSSILENINKFQTEYESLKDICKLDNNVVININNNNNISLHMMQKYLEKQVMALRIIAAARKQSNSIKKSPLLEKAINEVQNTNYFKELEKTFKCDCVDKASTSGLSTTNKRKLSTTANKDRAKKRINFWENKENDFQSPEVSSSDKMCE